MSMKTYRACFAYDAPRYRRVTIEAHSNEEAVARFKLLAQNDDFWEEYDQFESEVDFDACRIVYIDDDDLDDYADRVVAEGITDFSLTKNELLALAFGSLKDPKNAEAFEIVSRIRELVGQLGEVTNGK